MSAGWIFVAGCALEASREPMSPSLPDAAPPTADILSDRESQALSTLGYVEGRQAEEPAAKGFGDDLDRSPVNERLEPGGAADERRDDQVGAMRAWFPDTFLWQPLVETGPDGTAEVPFVVPDTLTAWRVLGLAHDASGRQAGAVATFDSTLPLYVDPVVPGWLYSGDRVLLPVQAVNTTAVPVKAVLQVRAEGAASGVASVPVLLGAGGSVVRVIPLDAAGHGDVRVEAVLSGPGATDGAQRVVRVFPAGRPVATTRSGTLSGARTFSLPGPADADPSTERVEVRVFPGPRAFVQAERERLIAGSQPENPAYVLAVVGPDLQGPDARRVRVRARQRIVYAALSPAPGAAADLLAGLPTADPLADELRTVLIDRLIGEQRADGTWSREERSTLQQVLVWTAFAARALPTHPHGTEHGARFRASGALERHLREVADPYTASVIVASGLLGPEASEVLLAQVRAGLTADPFDGVGLGPPPEARNAWGLAPSLVERLAWTCLALPASDPARADLAARLAAAWTPAEGFGAGPADIIALRAMEAALSEPAGPVDVRLKVAERSEVVGRVDPASPSPLVLEARVPSGAELVLDAEGSSGLVFVATRTSWVPWTAADRLRGVDVVPRLSRLQVGRTGTLTLALSAPSGTALHVSHGIPAGLHVEPSALPDGVRVQALPDRILVDTPPFRAGEVQTISIPVTPAFAGSFQTAPVEVSADGGPRVLLPPVTWPVGP